MLDQHVKQGHLIRIRRELFASVPVGADYKLYPINPYLIAGRITNDSIIAYHTALSFYQMAHSALYRFTFLTNQQVRSFHFRAVSYQSVRFPSALANEKNQQAFVNVEDVQGRDLKVTSLERTLVDVLDRPRFGGGWEEIYRSLGKIQRLKIDKVIEYALLLDNATTIAKVGFYLSQRQKELNVDSKKLDQLKKHIPASRHYVDSLARKNGQLIDEWNIIVSKEIVEQSWEEPLE